jgi:hypothetical protein
MQPTCEAMKSKVSEFESAFNISKELEKQLNRVVDDLVLCDLPLECGDQMKKSNRRFSLVMSNR